MSQIQVGPPNLKEANPQAVAVASYLRHHKLLKQREGILNGQRQEFFRVKRAVRALLAPEYAKAAAKNPMLPKITSKEEAIKAFNTFPFNRLAFNVDKLETQDALAQGLKPASGVPVLKISAQQTFGDDDYFVWFYQPVKLSTFIYSGVALTAVFAIVLFPLWPYFMRKGVWYLSMGMLGVLGLFFAMAIVRLIIFVITYFVLPRGFWLFPNLFEDVSVIDSFIPLYGWHGLQYLPEKKKPKKKAKKKQQAAPSSSPSPAAKGPITGRQPGLIRPGAAPAGGLGQMPPQMPPQVQNAVAQLYGMYMQKLGQVNQAFEKRKQDIVGQPDAPKDPKQLEAVLKPIAQEELHKVQPELEKILLDLRRLGVAIQPPGSQPGAPLGAAAAAQQTANVLGANTGSSTGASTTGAPVQRKVTLEDDTES
jgi:translocation protein SEC62